MNKLNLILIFVLMFVVCSGGASAWWNSSWDIRKDVDFTNATRYNEPILLNLSNICGSNCSFADYRDIRIIENISGTEYSIPYEFLNISGYKGSNDTNYYAHFIANDTSSIYYVYYDNPLADFVNSSVFIVYDPAEIGNVGNYFWSVGSGSASTSDTRAKYGNKSYYVKNIEFTLTVNGSNQLYQSFWASDASDDQDYQQIFLFKDTVGDDRVGEACSRDNGRKWAFFESPNTYSLIADYNAPVWQFFNMNYTNSTDMTKFTMNNSYYDSSNILSQVNQIYSLQSTAGEHNSDMYLDDYRLSYQPHTIYATENTIIVGMEEREGIILISPPNANINNSGTLNFTYRINFEDSIITSASLWTNITGTWQLNKSNSTEIINDLVNYFNDTYIPNGYFIWNVQVCDNNSNCSFAIANYSIRIDTTDPIITPNPNLPINKTAIVNGTLTTYINFSDDRDIYSINVMLGNGTILYDGTNLGITSYQYNISRAIAETGISSLTAKVCDSHTDSLIKSLETKEDNKGIKYVMEKEFIFIDKEWIHIYPKNFLNYDTPSTLKKDDRYSFTFNKKIAPDIETFVVESSHYIDINKNQEYNGHLIIPGIKKGYWVDFENLESTKYEIKRISDNKVEVTVYGLKNKEITFNSIGELNCVTETYYFININPSTAGYTSELITGDTSTMYLNITEHSTFDLSVNATLYYNNTDYNVGTTSNFSQTITAPTVSGNQTNVSFFWKLNVEDTDYNLTEYNQTITNFYLNACENGTQQAINFTIRDEDDSALLDGNINGVFNYSYNNIYKTYDYSVTDENTSQICIYPNYITFTGDYYLYYDATNYPQRRYYDYSMIVDNVSTEIPLYLLHTDEGIYGRFVIVDGYQNPLSNVQGRMQRTISGTTRTVEQQSSDNSGLMTFWLDPDEDYVFTFTKTGYESESFTLRVTTTEIYTVTLGGGGTTENNQSYATGITPSFTPSGEILQNDTDYTFMFNMTSDYWTITDCTLYILNGTTVLDSSSVSYDADSCDISITYNTDSYETIISRATYSLNGTEINTSVEYRVWYTYTGQFSLRNFLDDLKSFGDAGFSDTTRMIIAFLIIVCITAFTSIKMGLREPISLTVLVIGMIWFFAYLGWLTINYESIPTEWLKQYILAILLSLIGGSYLMNEVSR